ncbi:MAG: hypothetical protein ACOCP8_03925 [archaeon]
MNWYKKIIKIAQIWNVSSDSLKDKLKAIYELEYKYQAINNNNNISPQRKENILNQIEKKLQEIIPEIKDIFLEVFEDWLRSHALLEPSEWAESRVETLEMEDETTRIDNALEELYRYTMGGVDHDNNRIRQYFLSNMDTYVNQVPALKHIKGLIQEDYKENKINELDIEELKYFNEEQDTNFPLNQEGIDQAIEYIENMDFNLELSDLIDGIDTLTLIAENIGLFEELIFQIYRNLVFPAWYEYWKSMGIEETRENVENVYNMLKQDSNNIREEIKKINIALNTAHQNGNLIEDYFDGDIDSDFLMYLSNGSYVKEIDKELSQLDAT